MTDPYSVPTGRRPSPLPVVDAIRDEVDAWRRGGYPGTSGTSRRLLEHWFLDQHQTPDGEPFAYFFAQREAVETIIYLHEVAQVRSTDALYSRFGEGHAAPASQPFARYVVKMATGSGKTKVMSLVVAWAYFHSAFETNSPLSTTSLLVAPNLIVYERLREDFEAGRIFRRDPVLPPEWESDFDLQVLLRDEVTPLTATGVLWLTNVHVLYDRRPGESDNPVQAVLGPAPPAADRVRETVIERIARRGKVLVINDEAHHLHDQVRSDTGEPLKAVEAIHTLDDRSEGVVAQLDFSATPRNQRGQPFPEIVSDYPLADAIDDGIVKRPVIGELRGDLETPSTDAGVRYRQRILAAVERWKADTERLEPAGFTPLLFVMTEDTNAADDVAWFLESQPELTGRVLTIHVNLSGRNTGEIRKADLELARQFARQADSPQSPYRAIVSVLMLREGWDVRNVTVILPLRAYSAEARILPEQTLGRGLRRMTRPGSGVDERVVVIEHQAFRSLWDEQLADLDLEWVDPGEAHVPSVVIAVEPHRVGDFDIEVPQLSRQVERQASGVERLTVDDLPMRYLELPALASEEAIEYTGRDLRTGEVVERATYPIPRASDPQSVLAWYVHEVQRENRLTGQFHVLAPLVRDYIEQRAFGTQVHLHDERVLQALTHPAAQETLFEVFRTAISVATLVRQPVKTTGQHRQPSQTRPFLWSGETADADKSVFNRQPCDSGLEVQLAGFLDRCGDVAAFAKLAPQVRVSMDYQTAEGRLAFYYPDFAVRLTDGSCMLIEAKGLVDVDVPEKDRRAHQWAVDASLTSGVDWRYERIDQDLFERHAPSVPTLASLVAAVRANRRADARSRYARGVSQNTVEEHLEIMRKMRERIEESGDVPDVDAALDRFRDGGP